MKKYKQLYEDKKDELLARDDVTGVFYGFKTKGGVLTDRPALIVHVKEKKPVSQLAKGQKIPKTINKLETDVLEVNLEPMAIPQYSGDYYHGTLQPGISIGAEAKWGSGTWGAIVYDIDNNYAPGILSNHHVIVDKYSERNPYIKQPGTGKAFEDRIAETHSTKYYLGSRGDFAFATLLDYRPYMTNMNGSNIVIQGAKDPELGHVLEKIGRTTGLTRGMVTSFGTSILNYTNYYTDAWYGSVEITGFMIQPLVDPYELIEAPGDSGSLWYYPDTGIGAAILIGGTAAPNPIYCFAGFLTWALADLNVSIIQQTSAWKPDEPLGDTEPFEPIASLFPTWLHGTTPQYFDISLITQENLSNVCLFTDNDFIDSTDGGIVWIKRGDTYLPVGGYSNAYLCNIGDVTANIPVPLTVMIKNSNNLSLSGNYVIPLYVAHGNNIDVAGMGSWTTFAEMS